MDQAFNCYSLAPKLTHVLDVQDLRVNYPRDHLSIAQRQMELPTAVLDQIKFAGYYKR